MNPKINRNYRSPIPVNKVESTIKNISTKKTLGPDGFTNEVYQTIKEDAIHLMQALSEYTARENAFQLAL